VVRSLEEELGYPVLVRSHRGVSFTDEGRQLLIVARNIQRERQKARAIGARRRALSLRVSIGNSDEILGEVARLIGETPKENDMAVTIVNLSVGEALESVYTRRIDLAYVIVPAAKGKDVRDYAAGRGLEAWPFRDFACRVTLRRGHPLLRAAPFSFDELWDYPCVDFVDQAENAYGAFQSFINPRKKIYVDHYSLRAKLVAQTDAYAVGIGGAGNDAGGNVVAVPVPDLTMRFFEVRRRDDARDPLFLLLRERVMEHFQSLDRA
ncbi:MAG: LysR family transcriptional regulator, partial [Pyramidobacter sp.]|nr:LysR family transcriptional regulator [Pyramidobacter sp.]